MHYVVFRDEINNNIPSKSSLGNKSSDIVGSAKFSPNKNLETNYSFALDNDMTTPKYHEFKGTLDINNFITTFKYAEERANIGDGHYWSNESEFIFNESSSLLFSTRKNKKIDLTEYYDIIYQYKNDCLTAALQFKKEFYVDSDIRPTEQLFFSITIVPLGAYETENLVKN